jgi:hypothetical protein
MERVIYFLLVTVFAFNIGCENTVNLKAPYEVIPVVYCLLDQTDSYHYVKVSKLFNGDLDANEMAKVADSSYVDVKEIKVERILEGGVVDSNSIYYLRDTVLSEKESGVFYGPDQILYYFYEPFLNSKSEYRLTVDVGNGKPAVATTSLIEDSNPFSHFTWSRFTGGVSLISNESFNQLQVKLVPAKNTRQTAVNMYFTYCTQLLNGDSYADTIRFQLGSKLVDNPEVPKELDFTLEEGLFYKTVSENVPDEIETDGLAYRSAGQIFFEVVNAGEDFFTYMEVNSPTNAVFQQKPPYTNFENGLGVFSARTKFYSHEIIGGGVGFALTGQSEKELVQGTSYEESYGITGTGGKGFQEGKPINCF